MKGSFHQSRRESNFYNSMNKEEQIKYAKRWVATLNEKLLIPFIKITGASKHNREVFYEIDDILLGKENDKQALIKANIAKQKKIDKQQEEIETLAAALYDAKHELRIIKNKIKAVN